MDAVLDAGVVDEMRMLVCPASRHKHPHLEEFEPEAVRGDGVRERRGLDV